MQNNLDLVAHLRQQHLASALDSDIAHASQRTSRFKLVLLLWAVIGAICGIVLALSSHSYGALS